MSDFSNFDFSKLSQEKFDAILYGAPQPMGFEGEEFDFGSNEDSMGQTSFSNGSFPSGAFIQSPEHLQSYPSCVGYQQRELLSPDGMSGQFSLPAMEPFDLGDTSEVLTMLPGSMNQESLEEPSRELVSGSIVSAHLEYKFIEGAAI